MELDYAMNRVVRNGYSIWLLNVPQKDASYEQFKDCNVGETCFWFCPYTAHHLDLFYCLAEFAVSDPSLYQELG